LNAGGLFPNEDRQVSGCLFAANGSFDYVRQ
jgi:hypothetical protein